MASVLILTAHPCVYFKGGARNVAVAAGVAAPVAAAACIFGGCEAAAATAGSAFVAERLANASISAVAAPAWTMGYAAASGGEGVNGSDLFVQAAVAFGLASSSGRSRRG